MLLLGVQWERMPSIRLLQQLPANTTAQQFQGRLLLLMSVQQLASRGELAQAAPATPAVTSLPAPGLVHLQRKGRVTKQAASHTGDRTSSKRYLCTPATSQTGFSISWKVLLDLISLSVSQSMNGRMLRNRLGEESWKGEESGVA